MNRFKFFFCCAALQLPDRLSDHLMFSLKFFHFSFSFWAARSWEGIPWRAPITTFHGDGMIMIWFYFKEIEDFGVQNNGTWQVILESHLFWPKHDFKGPHCVGHVTTTPSCDYITTLHVYKCAIHRPWTILAHGSQVLPTRVPPNPTFTWY